MLVDALRLSTFGLFSVMGGWVLYTDLRYKKVRNAMVLAGLGFAAAAYLLALTATLLGTVGVPLLGGLYHSWSFYRALSVHALLAGGAAVGLWKLQIWPAGDAKLFFLFSLLLPLAEPNMPGFPGWLFMTCLINVFLPPAFWIMTRALAWAADQLAGLRLAERRAELAATVREHLAAWRADPAGLRAQLWARSLSLVYFFSFFLVLFAARRNLPVSIQWISPLVSVTALIAVSWYENRYNKPRGFLLPYVCVGAALYIAWYGANSALGVIARCLQFTLTVGLATDLAYAYLSRLEVRKVPVEELTAYQVLAPETLGKMNDDIVFLGEHFSLTTRDGIQPGQLDSVKDWLKRRGETVAHVYNTTPFAAWIVLGFTLTLWLRADIAWLMRPDFLQWGGTP